MTFHDMFKWLGYPKHADTIYKILCSSHKPLSIAVVSKEAGVSRVVVYRCFKKLLSDELIRTVSIGRRKFYEIKSVRQLESLLKLNKKNTQKNIEVLIKRREREIPQGIRFLSGPAGISFVFDDVISHTPKGDTFFRYTSERDLVKVNQYLSRDYRSRRDQKKLERQVISNPVSGMQKKPRLERFVKFIPQGVDRFEQNMIQLLYGNRLAIIDLNLEQAIIIENKQLADFQKVIFKLLYKKL